jgi:hypothetical protein
MYAMDMRQYDPAIARWVVQDPVVHHDMSPYNAFDNNPVFWADPSGADAVYNWEEHDRGNTGVYTRNGNEVSFEDALASYGIGSDNGDKDKEKNKKKNKEKSTSQLMGEGYARGYSIRGAGFVAGMDGRDPYNPTEADEEEAGSNFMEGVLLFAPVGKVFHGFGLLFKFGSKQLNVININLAKKYLEKSGISSFDNVGGFAFSFGQKRYIYHNSLESAIRTPWSTTTLYSSRASAFNELALGYTGTTNFAQQIFTSKFYGLSITGTASRQGLTAGGGLQQLGLKNFSRKTTTTIFNAGF